jgi:hypothetical protein
MADRVVAGPIKIHQTLHGYADGHRLLSSSLELKARDSKLMLTLSDASGSSSGTDLAGYLTGYPLAEGGLYALARTWPAPEMPRPGCVWTHTLLVRFEDLATIPDLALLLGAFRRPDQAKVAFEPYEESIELEGESANLTSFTVSLAVARRFLSALYTNPHDKIISAEGGTEFREAISLALWSQQWPRLRRSFRFCTLVFADRSTEAFSFDLQFSPLNDRAARGRFNKMFDADRDMNVSASWLDMALSDLATGTRGPLRTFLRTLGAELSGGRELFGPFCQLHSAVGEGASNATDVVAAVALLEGPLAEADARGVRAAVVEATAKGPTGVSEREFAFAFRNFDVVSPEHREFIGRMLGISAWHRRPTLIGQLLEHDDELRRMVGEAALHALPIGDILTGVRTEVALLPQVLRFRPEILADRQLWALGGNVSRAALELLLRNPGGLANVLDTLIELLPTDAIDRVCESVGASTVLTTLTDKWDARDSTELPSRETPWLRAASSPTSIAYLLSQGRPRRAATLVVIASHFSPDDIPNDYGQDPWFTALSGARGNLAQRDDLFLKSWTLARALGRRSRNQAELFRFAFEDVYVAVLDSCLPEHCWDLLDGKLVDSKFWGSWDRGRRVRAGVASAFVERELNPHVFGNLTKREDIFEQLALEANTLFWGRNYLKHVKHALKEEDDDRLDERIEILKDIL